MLRTVLLAISFLMASNANAADLHITAVAPNATTVTATVQSHMASPGMPLPEVYMTKSLTPEFMYIPMPGMPGPGMPVYVGHKATIDSAVLQGNGWTPGTSVHVLGYAFVPYQGLVEVIPSHTFQ